MSVFGPPWEDIDDTKAGTAYVVNSDGWGWFAIFIIVAIPFLAVGTVIYQISSWISNHPILSGIIYLMITFLSGIIFYSRPTMRHRICGIIATIITMLPLGIGVGLYAIPYVMLDGSFSSAFDWVLITLFAYGIIFFIFSICNILRNGIIHMIIGVVFLVFASLLISGLISSASEVLSWEAILQLYGF